MNEINFFEVTKKKRKSISISNINTYMLPIALIVILVLFVIPIVLLNNQVAKLELQKAALMTHKQTLTDSAMTTTSTDVSEPVDTTKLATIENIKAIESFDKISYDTMDTIKSAIPSSLFLNNMTIADNTITITGYSKSSGTIAKFQNSLERSDNIKDVFVSDIVKDIGNYSFTLTAKVGS